jgi:hypothetical protein
MKFNNKQERIAQRAQTRNARATVKQWMEAHQTERVTSLRHVHVYRDRIIRMPALLGVPEIVPIAGVTATVDTAGNVAYKGKKKVDTREVWVTIDGPGFQWVLKAGPSFPSISRDFAARINTAARQASTRVTA